MWGFLGSPKIINIGFEAQGHLQKSRNHRNEGFLGSPISKSKRYKTKMDQNNSPELLSILFLKLTIKFAQQWPKTLKTKNFDLLMLFLWSICSEWEYIYRAFGLYHCWNCRQQMTCRPDKSKLDCYQVHLQEPGQGHPAFLWQVSNPTRWLVESKNKAKIKRNISGDLGDCLSQFL